MEIILWMAKSIFAVLQLPGKLAFEIITVIIEMTLLVLTRCNRRVLVWGIVLITATEVLNLFAEDATMMGLEWLLLLIRMLCLMTAESDAAAALTLAALAGILLLPALRRQTSGRSGLRRLYAMPPLAPGRSDTVFPVHHKYNSASDHR